MKLNLACGQMYLNGWWNVDNQSMYLGTTRVDENVDCLTYEHRDDQLDELLVSHFVQYIKPPEIATQVKKWLGWLKPGGKIEIEATDFDYILTHADDKDWARTHLFGDKLTCPCRWSWTTQELVTVCQEVGFRDITVSGGKWHGRRERDFLITAIK